MIRSFVQNIGSRNPDCVFEQLDPRCKLIVVSVITFMIIFGNEITCVVLFSVSAILALSTKLVKLFLLMSLFFLALWSVFMLVFVYLMNEPVDDAQGMFFGMVFKGTVLVVMGAWFAVTTKLRDLTLAMEDCRVPMVIVLAVTIAVRFIPTLFNESMVIRDSMKLRKIVNRKLDLLKRPHLIGQSYISLVIIRSLKMADELAAVAETRGLGRRKSYSLLERSKFKKNDYCALAALVGVVVLVSGLSVVIN